MLPGYLNCNYNKKKEKKINSFVGTQQTYGETLNQAIRSHWEIGNNLHWLLDVVFNEYSLLKKKDYSAINFNMIAKIALTLLEKNRPLMHQKRGRDSLLL